MIFRRTGLMGDRELPLFWAPAPHIEKEVIAAASDS
jgi:hypothetical protein